MKFLLAVFAASLVDASAVQRPWHTKRTNGTDKPLISSKAIEAAITSENLLKRATRLSEIADLSIDDYGHPTRVIGSKGNKSFS
jgi:aminopeptidase Y